MKGYLIVRFSLMIVASILGCKAQCNGPSQYILPENSTGNLAVPASNFDLITTSWRNDNFYPANVACTWILKAPPLHSIYLKILFFSTEKNFDFVTLYGSEDRSNQLFRYSGELNDVWEAVTPKDTLVVDFESDDMTTDHGFHFAYMYLPQACVDGGVEISETQLIALPPWNLQGVLPGPPRAGYRAPRNDVGDPLITNDISRRPIPRWAEFSSYPQGLNCSWFITIKQDQAARIEVLKFHTDVDDVLQIYGFDKQGFLKPKVKFVGQSIPRRIISSSKPLLLNFDSRMEETGVYSGFLLNVTFISRGCQSEQEIQSSVSGYISYPKFNLQRGHWLAEEAIYYGAGNCSWMVKAPTGYQFNLTIIHLKTREIDPLMIDEGNKTLFKFGGILPHAKSIVSSTNRIRITFRSDSESDRSGFLIHYQRILKNCSFTLDPERGEVRSPFFPDSYKLPLNCSWEIKPPLYHHFYLQIQELKLDKGDFIQITDGNESVIISSSSRAPNSLSFPAKTSITVNFLSDAGNNDGYFLLKYETYKPGACSFLLSMCGWKSTDFFQAWHHRLEENAMLLKENTAIGQLLPRGYKAELISPLIDSQGTGNHPRCVSIQYILSGHDAFTLALSVVMETKSSSDVIDDSFYASTSQSHSQATVPKNYSKIDQTIGTTIDLNNSSTTKLKKSDYHLSGDETWYENDDSELFKIQGSQGNVYLSVFKNISMSGPFRIRITYNRGYGPHYIVAIRSVSLSESPCSPNLQEGKLSLPYSCRFTSSFCGWKNSKSDDQNWEINGRGIKAFAHTSSRIWMSTTLSSKKKRKLQYADLLSPDVEKKLIFDPNDTFIFFNISYRLNINDVELKVLIRPKSFSRDSDILSGFRIGNQDIEIWRQGLRKSPKIFHSRILVFEDILPEKFQFVLRAVVTSNSDPLETVSEIHLHQLSGVDVFGITIKFDEYNDFYDGIKDINDGHKIDLNENENILKLNESFLDETKRLFDGSEKFATGKQNFLAENEVFIDENHNYIDGRDFLIDEKKILVDGNENSDPENYGNSVDENEVSSDANKTLIDEKYEFIDCNFNNGFCSWAVLSDDSVVWNIKADVDNNSFAYVSTNGGISGTTRMISPKCRSESPKYLSFHYRMDQTNQCLTISRSSFTSNREVIILESEVIRESEILWMQCKTKGSLWLKECIEIPGAANPYQLMISSDNGPADSIVWIDNISIKSKSCSGLLENENEAKVEWNCLVHEATLCGFTQPSQGIWHWEYFWQSDRRDSVSQLVNLNLKDQQKMTKSKEKTQYDLKHFLTLDKTDKRPENVEKHDLNHFLDLERLQNPKKDGLNKYQQFQQSEKLAGNLKKSNFKPYLEQHKSEDYLDNLKEHDLNYEYLLGLQRSEKHLENLKNLNIHDERREHLLNTSLNALKNVDVGHQQNLVCPNGKLLEISWICDGVIDCEDGHDEKDCDWISEDPTDINGYQRYSQKNSLNPVPISGYNNAGRFTHFQESANEDLFQCSKGLLMPKSFLCDGRKDCPLDGLDEIGCFHCNPHEYLCPPSGVCIPKTEVCDGQDSEDPCTDELFCNDCPVGHMVCNTCVPSSKICDGIWDCDGGEDETRCPEIYTHAHNILRPQVKSVTNGKGTGSDFQGDSYSFPKGHHRLNQPGLGLLSENSVFDDQPFGCLRNFYRCSNNRCIPPNAVCNRIDDCLDGEDEFNCFDDNFEEETYLSAKIYPSLSPRGPDGSSPSYLITPVFHHRDKDIKILSFNYRLDNWIGSSNISLSVEMLDPFYSKLSLLPTALWRQTGHKGRHWQKAEVYIPPVKEIEAYRIGFIVSGRSSSIHKSDQIHLSKIAFKSASTEYATRRVAEWAKCSFAGTFCQWSQPIANDGYSWVYATTSTHSRRTGPIAGYSGEEDSGFIFTDSSQGKMGSIADLVSQPLQFENKDEIICLRFAIFLYGSNVGTFSVHLKQVHWESEIFLKEGSQGQSWIVISVAIKGSMLKKPDEPFVIILRSTKGTGDEGDIAVDHVWLTDGNCTTSSMFSSASVSMFTNAFSNFSSSHTRILAVSNGLTLSPYRGSRENAFLNENLSGNHSMNSKFRGQDYLLDPCKAFASCQQCLSNKLIDCSWCSKTQACGQSSSPSVMSCSENALFYRESDKSTTYPSGSFRCPSIVKGESTRIPVAANDIISVVFAVTNIPASLISKSWRCRFSINHSKSSLPNITAINSSFGSGNSDRGGEKIVPFSEFNDAETSEWIVDVQGKFQGTVYNTGQPDENSKVGVGAVLCGDEETLMMSTKGSGVTLAKVSISTDDKVMLDNLDDVHVMIYNCSGLAADCNSCIQINNTIPCGWCSSSSQCTRHSKCHGGLWHSHSTKTSDICSVQSDLDMIRSFLEGADPKNAPLNKYEENHLDIPLLASKAESKNFTKMLQDEMRKKMIKQENTKIEIMSNDYVRNDESSKGKLLMKNKKKRNGNDKEKSSKMKRKSRGKGKGFLKVPIQDGVFLARNVWKLHTGKQYYIPVEKRTLINLGFVRHVNYGPLAEEKSRTLLLDGSWKKAAGFFIDLYEKSGEEPVTSIVTTRENIFKKMIKQIIPE